MLLCKFSLRYSAHLLPPWPSKTPNIYSLGHLSADTLGTFVAGWMTLRMIEILSSFTLRTVPTLVLAAKDLTGPNGFIDTLECVKVLRPLFCCYAKFC
jgi:hypothetical protein